MSQNTENNYENKNKGAIILYLVIMIFSLLLMNDVSRENKLNDTYVMVNNN